MQSGRSLCISLTWRCFTAVITERAIYLFPSAIQTALRLQWEGKSSLHHELKLKRRRQRENSRSARSSCSSQSSLSDDSNHQDMAKIEKGKDRQDLEIESIIQVSKINKQLIDSKGKAVLC